MLDYKLIEALAMVVQEKGFDKAARVLHITQSAVSQRIKLLEEQMGQVLLTRTTPPRATSPGKRLLRHYLKVRRLENDLQDEMDRPADRGFATIAVGVNADSLATWLYDAIRPFLVEKKVLLDIRTDDQEETLRLLQDGEVAGCISTRETPVQGCRIAYLGCMHYHLFASPYFAQQWFPQGLTAAAAAHAPAILFNRKDRLHHLFLDRVFGDIPDAFPIGYVPSSEKFADFIAMGLGYGTLPRQQSDPLVRDGRLVDLAPEHKISVKLFWHCWNLKSNLLDALTGQLIRGARTRLENFHEPESSHSDPRRGGRLAGGGKTGRYQRSQ